MIWRIVESKRGFIAQRGTIFRDVPPIGNAKESFMVYESARFDTRRQAEKYIERKSR